MTSTEGPPAEYAVISQISRIYLIKIMQVIFPIWVKDLDNQSWLAPSLLTGATWQKSDFCFVSVQFIGGKRSHLKPVIFLLDWTAAASGGQCSWHRLWYRAWPGSGWCWWPSRWLTCSSSSWHHLYSVRVTVQFLLRLRLSLCHWSDTEVCRVSLSMMCLGRQIS